MKKFLIAVCLLSSCRVPDDFWREYRAFYTDAATRGCVVPPINVYSSRLESGIAGLCVYYFGIILNQDLWREYGPYQRLELMYHEIGHCGLGLEHSDGIMSPTIHTENEVKENWTQWKEDFFAQCIFGFRKPL